MHLIVAASRQEDEFAAMTRKMGSWVDQILGPSFRKFSPAEAWTPAINQYEDKEAFYVVADLAGAEVSQIDLHTEDGLLHIAGSRQMPRPPSSQGQVRVHMMEIDHGSFSRKVQIPPGADVSQISASYRGGFLAVRIPKK